MSHSPIQKTLALVDKAERHILEVALSESLSLSEKLSMLHTAEQTLSRIAEVERLRGNTAFAAEIVGRIDRIIARAEHHALTADAEVWEEVKNFTIIDRVSLFFQRLFRRKSA